MTEITLTQFIIYAAIFVFSCLVTLLILAAYRLLNNLGVLAEEFATSLRSRTMNDKQSAALISRADTLLCRLLEGTKNFEQLGADLRFYFSELERERLHRAANRNKFAVPPDVAEAIAKEWADLDRQAKIEPCPGAALNQHIHPLPEDPEPRKN